jgi:methanogenic corrinoid protein MtbC1
MQGPNTKGQLELRLGQLVALTGLSPQLIRVWERRYGFPSGSRTEGGHRRYSAEQADQLRRAVVMVRSGFRPRDAINRVLAERVTSVKEAYPVGPDRLMSLLLAADAQRSLGHLRTAWLAFGLDAAIEDHLFPAMRWIGDEWAAGRASVAQEHAATGIARSWLGAVRAEMPMRRLTPSVLIAAPEGEEHDLGIFALELLLELRGVSALALGGNVPTTDLLHEVNRRRPHAVVLGIARSRLRRVAATVESGLHGAARTADREQPVLLYLGGRGAQSPLPEGIRPLPERITDAADLLAATINER